MTVHLKSDGTYLFHQCNACKKRRQGRYSMQKGPDGKIKSSLEILPDDWHKKGTKHYCECCRTYKSFVPVKAPPWLN